jgi:phosphoglycerate-specific signal transduction histidine kinase
MTHADVTALAALIAQAVEMDTHTASWIRTIHRLPDGAEALRLIVRDDIMGAGSAVADALWINL